MALNAKEARHATAQEKPFPCTLALRQRFDLLGVGEIWTEHWQAPAGVEIERIELELKG